MESQLLHTVQMYSCISGEAAGWTSSICLVVKPGCWQLDQIQIPPAASSEILHHTVWKTWLFIAYSWWKMIILAIPATSLIHFSLIGLENVLFGLGSERFKWLPWTCLFFVLFVPTAQCIIPKAVMNWSDECRVPDLNPFSDAMMKLISPLRSLTCPGPRRLMELRKGALTQLDSARGETVRVCP